MIEWLRRLVRPLLGKRGPTVKQREIMRDYWLSKRRR
jgi:hypothetical protein